jgi:HAD superfamily hydrolase (TIGR01509 family)
MIKTIIFDLDGVLVDAKKIHYDCLNKSLKEVGIQYVINWDEHISIYDGLKTNQKLLLLNKNKGLPTESFDKVWLQKQKYTHESLKQIQGSETLINCFSKLNELGYKIVCCSNSIRKTVITVLSKLGIIEFFDLILSNEDVKNSKPHPEIFWKAISLMNCLPEEALIVEDSPTGLVAANKSGSNVLRVKTHKDVNYEYIMDTINQMNSVENTKQLKWVDKKLNILIPMAGAGSRFENAGYTFPKPLIDINRKPMIQVVVDNLNIEGNFIFIVQKKHRSKYNLDALLNLVAPNCKIIEVDGITEGAACTTLLAKDFIDDNNPLIIANSDQYIEWDSTEFMYKMNENDCDAGIVTFNSTHPKWSFVKIKDDGFVGEVAEKKPISNIATAGIYYWKRGSDYVKYAEEMINENIKINNEFYVCPVFNQAIRDNLKIKTYNIDKMWGLGTPEDLNLFLKNKIL